MSSVSEHTDTDHAYLDWKDWQEGAFGTFSPKDDAYYTLELKKLGIRLDADSRVLEIGFGNGSFCGWVRKRTQHYIGVEANPTLLERAQQAGVEAYPSTQPLSAVVAGRAFDLVAIFDVLEHLEIERILDLLRSCRDCLASAGGILLRVPSGDSPFSAPLINGDITHRTLLGSKALVQLAKMLGLEVVTVRGQAFPVLGMGLATAMNRTAVVAGRAFAARLINAVYNGNERMVVDMNLVALLRRP